MKVGKGRKGRIARQKKAPKTWRGGRSSGRETPEEVSGRTYTKIVQKSELKKFKVYLIEIFAFGQRERHAEAAPLSRSRGNADGSIVGFDNPFGDGQTET